MEQQRHQAQGMGPLKGFPGQRIVHRGWRTACPSAGIVCARGFGVVVKSPMCRSCLCIVVGVAAQLVVYQARGPASVLKPHGVLRADEARRASLRSLEGAQKAEEAEHDDGDRHATHAAEGARVGRVGVVAHDGFAGARGVQASKSKRRAREVDDA